MERKKNGCGVNSAELQLALVLMRAKGINSGYNALYFADAAICFSHFIFLLRSEFMKCNVV